MKIRIGVSNRHIHLNRDILDILYGKDYQLNIKNNLTLEGQYAALETVTIKTTKSHIENVRILGPLREYTQVEISKTDAYKLGINPPLRNSGDLENSETLIIIGPKGEIELDNCCIIAKRHIHISKEDIIKFGLENKKEVSVKIDTKRGGILTNVYLKETTCTSSQMHIDMDEANALDVKSGDICQLMKEEI